MNDPASAAQQQPQDRGGADVRRHGSARSSESAPAAGGAPASTAGSAPAPAGVSEGGHAHSHESGHAQSHDSGHGHSHGHSHSHAPTDAPLRALLIVLGVTGTVFFAELIGGLITGSVALLADAMHMLSDAAGLIIAVVAIFIGRRAATAQATFGYRRVEVLAALVNAVTVLGISAWIVVEAFQRLSEPVEIMAGPMMIVAVIGLLANIISAWILNRQREHSVNVQGAFLHVLADMLGSVAVLVAGGVIILTGWQYADVIASLVIAALVLPRAWQLMMQALRILLEQAPPGYRPAEVDALLRQVDGVLDVHDLHLWSLDGTSALASVHLVVPEGRDPAAVLCAAQAALQERGIAHATIQVERASHADHEGPQNVC
ncbi:cation diffusion facilitator family transporter [Corynebacterium macclintockiae]|uniref:Cation diffusion facilitator family transporter n=1 Tax=Corynebacterium macclintockiae TaxID=2913501 RepID=A0A9X3M4A1_9CORY|nr:MULTISPECIES: cation diffusion facilitator family transporter [Corynebacterium]MBC6795526.1 cation transporter [Corynebacterium sp. LK28]MCZ9303987.1 cation diffusion facilitator family transporter [Corynebacterium macclintockiae]